MGAYENPITVVDTESAKMWANAIQGLGNSFVQSISEIKKRRAAIDKAQADQDEWTFNYTLTEQRKMLDALSKAGANNPSLSAMTDDLLFKNAEAVKRQKYGSTAKEKRLGAADAAKYQSLLSRIVPLFNGIKANKEDFTEHFDPTTNGDQGSLGYYGKANQEWQKIFSIETTINPGEIIWNSNDDYTDINITYKGERLDGPVTKKAAEVANYTFQIVPYSDKITSNLLKMPSKDNPGGLAVVGTNGNVNSQFLQDPSRYETVTSDDGTIETIIAPPDYSLIAATINQPLEKEAANILLDYEMANSIWMNTMNNTTELKRSGDDGIGAVSEEDSIEFTNAWKLRAGGLIPNVTYINPESEEGREFLESAEGREFMEQQGITKNEQGFYIRDINRDKKATMAEVGLIPDVTSMKGVVKGTKKVSTDTDTDTIRNAKYAQQKLNKTIIALGEKLEEKVIPTFSSLNDPNLTNLITYIENLNGIKKVIVEKGFLKGNKEAFRVDGVEKTITLDTGMSQAQIKKALLKAAGASDAQINIFDLTKTNDRMKVGKNIIPVPGRSGDIFNPLLID